MTEHSDDDPFATGAGLDLLRDVGDADLKGQRLGDYRIESLVAEGGMSRVYRAHRSDGTFERDVAIKVSTLSSASDSLKARFEQEQQVLASLNHPNISQLFDARVNTDGRPYIVMEFIDGTGIVEYCSSNGLPERERIRLLIDVVNAVAYAHARLVIHRDIKPSNVMVGADGRVKLLDFGIAKLLEAEQALTQATPMTPKYASPEQLLGQPITVASDIAQLGLLAFEVLTGHALNESETMADAIRRAADGKPLSVPSGSKAQLPRELLQVIEQCLRADPDERYRDASSLARDLKAYIDGYPVSAVGQSASYRFRKWLTRNAATSATAALALITIVGGTAWYTLQLDTARQLAETQAEIARDEADKSREISEFLVELMGAPIPAKAKGEDILVLDVLDQGVDKLRDELGEQPALKGELMATLGEVYNELGEFEAADALLSDAVNVHRGLADSEPLALAHSIFAHSKYFQAQGERQTAIDMQNEAIALISVLPSRDAEELNASLLNAQGINYSTLNQWEESEGKYLEAIRVHEVLYGKDHLETSVPRANYGLMLAKVARFDEAIPLLETTYQVAMDELGPYHPWIAPRAINLASAYRRIGRDEDAERLYRIALDQDRKLYGEKHHNVASSLVSLARFIRGKGRRDESIEMAEEALEIEKASLGEDHVYTAETSTVLANWYITARRLEAADALLQVAEPILVEKLGDHLFTGNLVLAKSRLAYHSGDIQGHIALSHEAIGVYERAFDGKSERLLQPWIWIGNAYNELGDTTRAADAYGTGIASARQVNQEDAGLYERHAELLEADGRPDEAATARARAAELRGESSPD